jgi:transcriptional regulator GlxA family with amidase domain
VLRQRILLAQSLLETGDLPIEAIAASCGFGSAAVLRTHFRRVVGTAPLAYRRTFRCDGDEDEEGAA